MKNHFRIDCSIVICHEEKFLFIKRSNNESSFPGYWGIPGGGVESFDLSLEDAVKRECREEIGITIDTPIKMIANNINNDKKIIFIVFVASVLELPLCMVGPEVDEVSWKTYKEIVELEKVTPCTVDIIKKYIEDHKGWGICYGC